MIRRLGLAVAAVAVLAGLFSAGVGGREIVLRLTSDSGETIHACRNTTTGALRAVSGPAACRNGEEPLSWNVQGPAGPPGPAGPAGPAGPPGESGDGDWLRRCALDLDGRSTFDCAVDELLER